jgi:hypothetical protein
MTAQPKPFRFAGIEHPEKISSIDVKTNSLRLRRMEYVLRELLRVGAGHLPARKEWELKQAIGRHAFEDAENASLLRDRILELRTTEAQIQKNPDGFLSLLMEEVIHAESDAEYLLGIYEVLRPALLETMTRHAAETQPLVDQPTTRVLGIIQNDLRQQIELGKALIREFVNASARRKTEPYLQRLRSLIDEVGGIDGAGEVGESTPKRWRSVKPYALPLKCARPDDFGPRVYTRQPGCLDPNVSDAENAQRELMRARQEEMIAAELVAGVLYSQPNMPWEFYRSLARHMWDEVRHSAFGQVALESHGINWRPCPHFVTEYDQLQCEAPAKAYTLLSLGIEHTLMARSGKQREVKMCAEIFKDPQMTLFQDYDWADEVTHAGFGKKWASAFFDDNFEMAKIYGDQFASDLVQFSLSQEPNPAYRSFHYIEKFGADPVQERARQEMAAAAKAKE